MTITGTQPNGCGLALRFLRVPQFIFEADCDKHDEYYALGGGLIEKIYADVMFYAYMLKDIRRYRQWYKRLFYFIIATIYLFGVSSLGLLVWKWKYD